LVLERADTTFVMLNKQLRTRMAELKESGGGSDEAGLELEASNRLYEEYLEQAGAIVAQNKGSSRDPRYPTGPRSSRPRSTSPTRPITPAVRWRAPSLASRWASP
jgi:hypothetical protein